MIPVHNEERDLPGCIRRLHDYLGTDVPYPARITVADNASTDGTLAVAHRLAEELPDVDVDPHRHQGPRRRPADGVDAKSPADVVAYMDVDLSTELSALMPLVAPVISGHSDLAIGSRLAPSSRVVRSPKREFVSRSYNLLLRGALGARFSDAQCGFKAVRADVARKLLPLVADTGWFFDTELLVIAETGRPADPRGTGRLDRRPGLAGRHRADRDRRPEGLLATRAGLSPPARCRFAN